MTAQALGVRIKQVRQLRRGVGWVLLCVEATVAGQTTWHFLTTGNAWACSGALCWWLLLGMRLVRVASRG